MTDRERLLARIARRQWGLFTTDQALDAGWSPKTLRAQVHAGRFRRVTRGVLALTSAPETWRQKAMAAVLAAGPGAVASHTTAAALYNLSACTFRGVEITVPRGRSHRVAGARVHESAVLPRRDLTVIEHIPVTRPARTLVDLAGAVSRRMLEEAVDDAVIRRLVTLDRLGARADALSGSGRPGSVLLAEVLATWDVATLPREVAEMRLFRRLVAHGLPAPVPQYEVLDENGQLIAIFDGAYPEELVGLELQSFRWHATPSGFARDQARLRKLAALGWLVIPATPLDLRGDGREVAGATAAARARVQAARTCPIGPLPAA